MTDLRDIKVVRSLARPDGIYEYIGLEEWDGNTSLQWGIHAEGGPVHWSQSAITTFSSASAAEFVVRRLRSMADEVERRAAERTAAGDWEYDD